SYTKVILHKIVPVRGVGQLVLGFEFPVVEQLGDDPLPGTFKLRIPHLQAGIQTGHEIVQIEAEARTGSYGDLSHELVKPEVPARIKFIFPAAPYVAEIRKDGSLKLGAEHIVEQFESVFDVAFQLDLPQLIQVPQVQAQVRVQHFTVISAGAQGTRLPGPDAIHAATIEALLKDQQAVIVAIRDGHTRINADHQLPVTTEMPVKPQVRLQFGILKVRHAQHLFLSILVFLEINQLSGQPQQVTAQIKRAAEIDKIFQAGEPRSIDRISVLRPQPKISPVIAPHVKQVTRIDEPLGKIVV